MQVAITPKEKCQGNTETKSTFLWGEAGKEHDQNSLISGLNSTRLNLRTRNKQKYASSKY